MRYIESPSTDPALNLALEQYVFDTLACNDEYFMLWRNRDSVIVGLHQNTAEEINRAYIDRHGIPVVRRLSGGGAVFHDLGNINFSLITSAPDTGKLDYRSSCQPIIEALEQLGIHAATCGRNDITIDGKKFSGSARYLRGGRLMHHGTILLDTDLERMSEALRVPEDTILSKAVKSIHARVTNLRNYLPRNLTALEFMAFLRASIAGRRNISAYSMTGQDWDAVEAIRLRRYAAWEWNYGQSPDYRIRKSRHLSGFGDIRISMQVEKGRIRAFAMDGDYFGSRTCADIAAVLPGTKMEEKALEEALSRVPLEDFYEGLSRSELIRLIIE
jgi:lipoate-protein ligase A